MAEDPDRYQRARIEARQDAARRFGFRLGCVAAVIAAVFEFIHLRVRGVPLSLENGALLALMAMLNVPLGILFALIGERVSRGSRGGPGTWE